MKISWINGMYKENLNTSGQHRIAGGNYTAVTVGGVQKVALKRYSCGDFDFEFHAAPLIARLTLCFNSTEIIGGIGIAGHMEYNRRMKEFEQKELPRLPNTFPPNQYDYALDLPKRIEQIPEAIERCKNILKMINSDFMQINDPLGCCNYDAGYNAWLDELAWRKRLIKRKCCYEETTETQNGWLIAGKDGYMCLYVFQNV